MSATKRFQAIGQVQNRKPVEVILPAGKISEFYESNVFTKETMRKYLSEEAFLSVMASIQQGDKIDRTMADQVAASMKSWAMDKGATSYTHWFQPLTGATAEKHDTFFKKNLDGSGGIENFSGDALVQQEPDASSFPNGGIRVTFEARGYTAWDPSSPAFIMETGQGKTLCIPTIFISYTGESLGYKAPLLSSQTYLEDAAVAVCQYFDKSITKVTPTLGWEQEYFLVDEALYYSRPDLINCGRTLVGHRPAKGQQLDDHYFGSIPERVYSYMFDFEKEALKLGIPLTTRHNEVAPGQFECAPVFSDVNLAVDQNQLLMDVMSRVASKHKLKVLFHEKPYAGINGSGKHNNWSMSTNTGKNLLSPGKTPKKNLQFLTFFVATIAAVHKHADLIRAAIASAPNDHRLGANEAPPAIISVFIGSTLTEVLNTLEKTVKKGGIDEISQQELKIDINKKIPDVLLDNTDRNRTSPFAFTGNKFEMRAVGSSANCALPMTVLNTAVGEQLRRLKKDVDALIKGGEKKEGAILRVLRRYIKESKAILFEGDNYSDAWAKEAKKRGLSNVKNTPDALNFFESKAAKKLFTEADVLTETELEARVDVWWEIYQMKIQIESRTLGDICLNQVIPACIQYQNDLINNVKGLKEIGLKKSRYKAQVELIDQIAERLNVVKKNVIDMIEARKAANKIDSSHKKAQNYYKKVVPYFEVIRYEVDKLEMIIDDAKWPLPKYRELLFIK